MNPQCPICHSDQSVITINKAEIPVRQCPCGVKFKDNRDGSIDSWSFETTIGERTFKLIFIKELMGKPEFSVWRISSEYALGSEVLRFNFLPNITPQNAKEKVKLYLLFS